MNIVKMEKTPENIRFKVVNHILSQADIFSEAEIVQANIDCGEIVEHIVKDCIEDLMNSGIIYEIGRKYKVRKNYKGRGKEM